MQRVRKRKLDRGEPSQGMTAERAARLTALGLIWVHPSRNQPNEVKWEAQLARLVAYKAAHGDCSVPQRWAEDPPLANWVKRQRAGKRGLDRGQPSEGVTAARATKLEALGFSWAPSPKPGGAALPNEAAWEVQLARLLAYKGAHGDFDVPQGWAEDPPLANWVKKQRACKRALDRGEPSEGMTAERAAKLTVLGFAWEGSNMDDAGWEAQLAKLKAYKRKHGDCSVPRGWAEDPRLSQWVSTQRKFKRALDRGEPSEGMTAERAAKLTVLGLKWDGAKRSSEDAQSAGSASGAPKKQPRLQ
jgi:hypothetical protein